MTDLINIVVNEKTKDLAICRGNYPKEKCREVNLGKELTEKERKEYNIHAIELDLDKL